VPFHERASSLTDWTGRTGVSSTLLHLRVSGDQNQPVIVFLHAVGTSGWMWEDQFQRLSGFRCIAPDLPGHGLSRSVPWRSLDDTADRIADIIRGEVPGRKAHVVGLSLGAYVGLTLLSRHQEVVDRAVLSGINVLPLPHKWLMILPGYVMAPLLKTPLGARINALTEYSGRIFRRLSAIPSTTVAVWLLGCEWGRRQVRNASECVGDRNSDASDRRGT
jgi:pimeloyl-ACP methyl ester carboxylesterase